MIGSVIGVAIFLTLMLFSVQALFGLYATTVVGAAAADAAFSVAAANGAGVVSAEGAARRRIGALADRARFRWSVDGDVVQVTIRAPRPRLLPGGLGLPDIERTARARVERVR